jgi:hypothetical protein
MIFNLPGAMPSAPEPAPPRSARALWWSLAAGLVLVVAVVLYHHFRQTGNPPAPPAPPPPVASNAPSATSAPPVTPVLAQPVRRTNSLGMIFNAIPGPNPMFCIWETRVNDYAIFANAVAGLDESWRKVELSGVPISFGPDHPVTMVNWKDAKAFCQWLTEKERLQGFLRPGEVYRLPTDLEWSAAAGLTNEAGRTPQERSLKGPRVFPWGLAWPPPKGAGNFADRAAKASFPHWIVLEGYDDGYATTAPVGRFQPNQYGLYDLSGNVSEWCEDSHLGGGSMHVRRGGSWESNHPDLLLCSHRESEDADDRHFTCGFRVVLAAGPPAK